MCDRPPPYEALFARGPYRLVRCPACRLVFQDPQPEPDVLEHAYYHDAEFADALLGDLRAWTLQQAEHKLELLDATAGALSPGRALDVGCSSGAWLQACAARGWQATGIEPGAHTAAAARARGLDVHTGTLQDVAPTLAPAGFDLITFWDVLEHLRDPRRELELAAGLLAPGGVLAATMPNVEGWYPRATYRLFARSVRAWEYPDLPVHLHDFGPATVRALLARAGFQVRGIRTWPVPFWYYRQTTLARGALGGGRRAAALGFAFAALHALVYPSARLFDRSNALAVAAVRAPGVVPASRAGAGGSGDAGAGGG